MLVLLMVNLEERVQTAELIQLFRRNQYGLKQPGSSSLAAAGLWVVGQPASASDSSTTNMLAAATEQLLPHFQSTSHG